MLDAVLAVTSFPAYDGLGATGDDPDLAASLVLRMVTALGSEA
ncbi:hypothetical protein [Actinoplanes friuliensis]|nr:hypothetical protein [Actinoplanes friuliensis]